MRLPKPNSNPWKLCEFMIANNGANFMQAAELFALLNLTARYAYETLRRLEVDGLATRDGNQFTLNDRVKMHVQGVINKAACVEVVQPRTPSAHKPLKSSFYANVMSRINADAHYLTSGVSSEPFRGVWG